MKLDTVFTFLIKSAVVWPKLLYDDYKIEKELEQDREKKVILFKNKKEDPK